MMNQKLREIVTLHLQSELRSIEGRVGHMFYASYDDVCFVTDEKFDGDEIPADEIHLINLDIEALMEKKDPSPHRKLILLRSAYITLDDNQENFSDKKCFFNLAFAIGGNCPLNPNQVPNEVVEMIKKRMTSRLAPRKIEFEGTWDVDYDGPVMKINSLRTECLGGGATKSPAKTRKP